MNEPLGAFCQLTFNGELFSYLIGGFVLPSSLDLMGGRPETHTRSWEAPRREIRDSAADLEAGSAGEHPRAVLLTLPWPQLLPRSLTDFHTSSSLLQDQSIVLFAYFWKWEEGVGVLPASCEKSRVTDGVLT